jgi:asparagine N-glycosylation enzyme membrane subunit Stt3
MTPVNSTREKPTGRIVIRSVALPSEHGGWGFLLEPILLGLLVAFSWEGALLSLAATGVFLIHQPLKMATKDRLKGRRPPRLVWAERFVVGYGLLAGVPMLILLATAPPIFLLPIGLAIPLAGVQLYYDARNRSRQLIPEIAGAAALAMIAPAMALLGGWAITAALVLWIILTVRAAAAILYVRSRIRLKIGKPTSPGTVWLAHVVALLVMLGLAVTRSAPWLGAIAFGVLLIRALLGLSRYRKDRPIKVIGFQELGYGLMTVIVVTAGYGLNI